MSRTVEQVCQDSLDHEALVSGCNEFVLAVVQTFDKDALSSGDKANLIVSRKMKSPPWIWIGEDPDEATRQANAGHLVLGGLTSKEMTYTDKGHQHVATMGHVVVVAPGGPSKPGQVTLMNGLKQAMRGGYPYCYQGAFMKAYRFRNRTQVDVVFPGLLLKKRHYAYIEIGTKK